MTRVAHRDDSFPLALALKARCAAVPEIVKKLTTKTGRNRDSTPAVASVHRALAEPRARGAAEDRTAGGGRHHQHDRVLRPVGRRRPADP